MFPELEVDKIILEKNTKNMEINEELGGRNLKKEFIKTFNTAFSFNYASSSFVDSIVSAFLFCAFDPIVCNNIYYKCNLAANVSVGA